MDGTDKKVIVTSKGKGFSSLSIDFKTLHLYWTVSRVEGIYRCGFDGGDQQKLPLLTANSPYLIGISNSRIYWLDLTDESAVEINNKVYRVQAEQLNVSSRVHVTNDESISEVILFAAYDDNITRPSSTSNPCKSHSCSHLCILTHTNTAGFSCMCNPDSEASCLNRPDAGFNCVCSQGAVNQANDRTTCTGLFLSTKVLFCIDNEH